ncbi:MAG: hypothetical protein ACI4F4_02180 [Lachnospiraceae bacterium]
MKWKNDVIFEKNKKQSFFRQNESVTQVEERDVFICDAVEDGITDEKAIIHLIMEQEKENEVLASLRLAQFVLDYSDYISNDIGHMVIEP